MASVPYLNDKISEDKNICFSYGNGRYPHSTSCSMFYECKDGIKKEVDCIGGFHFNPKTEFCDFPKNVNCKEGNVLIEIKM